MAQFPMFALFFFTMLALPDLSDGIDCYFALRYIGTPPKDLVERMDGWASKPLKNVKGTSQTQACQVGSKGFGCMTYSCQDANGDDIFVANGCKLHEGAEDCAGDRLNGSCAEVNGTPKCKICGDKENCNKNDFELKKSVKTTPPTTTTTTTTTAEPEGTSETSDALSTIAHFSPIFGVLLVRWMMEL
uniref:Uncharacterized protein n=1 Tax=Globodera pallida TaxID=36090 RepID=A0A183CF22_GLOPA